MKKIGIATITFTREKSVDFNYGNILQNYALTYFLENNNLEVNTVYYHPNYYLKTTAAKNKRKSLEQLFDDVIRVVKRNIYKKELFEKKCLRRKKFEKFLEDTITYSEKEYCPNSNLEELDSLYDYFVVGSDQVWNPFYEGSNEFYYLGFASEGKRISYAPSIAVNKIPKEIEKNFKEWVGNIDYLSVREEAGRDLLKKYNYTAKVVCDPVFLLSKEQWRKIEGDKPTDKYFLVYILGKKTVEIKKAINQLKKKLGIKVIDIYNSENVDSEFAGPQEFISYIDGAEFVFTNSFHGVAFSIIMNTPVVVVDRESAINVNNRIENILKIVGVKHKTVQDVIDNKGVFEEKYNYQNLEELIRESKEFLMNAILGPS